MLFLEGLRINVSLTCNKNISGNLSATFASKIFEINSIVSTFFSLTENQLFTALEFDNYRFYHYGLLIRVTGNVWTNSYDWNLVVVDFRDSEVLTEQRCCKTAHELLTKNQYGLKKSLRYSLRVLIFSEQRCYF